jgi:putative hydrolase of the HAD superfamily
LRPDGIRGVVLDLDDTLTDLTSFELELWDEVAKVLGERIDGLDLEELRRRYIAALHTNYQRVLDGEIDMHYYRRARLEEALAPWSELDDDTFAAYWKIKHRIVDQVPAKPGAHEALRALRAAGLQLAVLTNGPSDMQRDKLARLGFRELVDEVAISAEIGAAKPDSAAYDAVVQMLGLEPRELVMVGDNWVWEVDGALDAGFAAAYYVGSADPPGERPGARRLASIADLPRALGL